MKSPKTGFGDFARKVRQKKPNFGESVPGFVPKMFWGGGVGWGRVGGDGVRGWTKLLG